MNPLAQIAILALTLLLVVLIWRTASRLYVSHISPAKLRQRQLVDAQRNELHYRAMAEQAEAIADGYRRTIDRLAAPPVGPFNAPPSAEAAPEPYRVQQPRPTM